jgi:CRP-like cAMP-binding protein
MEFVFPALSETNIFRGLTAEQVEELFDGRPFRIREYERDQYIAYSNDNCHDMLFVLKGSVRGEMADFSGKKLKIEDIPAPNPLAVAFIFGRENRFPVDIIANEQATLLTIPRDVLIYILQNSKGVLQNYLNAISSRTQFLSNKIKFLSFKTIREKIANFILTNIPTDSNILVFRQTQNELADFFGITRPSLARALAEMEENGIIQFERNKITIQNKEKLNKLLNN